uniref:Uncharacterized protein n=1 Tax=Solanum tuberosum TaxID=4113 RepID=M1D2S1_SOLTU
MCVVVNKLKRKTTTISVHLNATPNFLPVYGVFIKYLVTDVRPTPSASVYASSSKVISQSNALFLGEGGDGLFPSPARQMARFS